MNNNNNNNNVSKKVAGYCVASFCVTSSMSKELNSGLPRDKYIYMLFSKLDLNTGLRGVLTTQPHCHFSQAI